MDLLTLKHQTRGRGLDAPRPTEVENVLLLQSAIRGAEVPEGFNPGVFHSTLLLKEGSSGLKECWAVTVAK